MIKKGKCELCGRTRELTKHEKIAKGAGGSITSENTMWICEKCHRKINSEMDKTIHKLAKENKSPLRQKVELDEPLPTTPAINLEEGEIELTIYAGSISCSSSVNPIPFIPAGTEVYVQAYPKDFDKQKYSYNIRKSSGTFGVSGGSIDGWLYTGAILRF